jgi:hypothetical protein
MADLTFLAALRCDGLAAPCVIDGLLPVLAPGDIVIMDMCGRPRRCKKNLFEEHGAWSGADM